MKCTAPTVKCTAPTVKCTALTVKCTAPTVEPPNRGIFGTAPFVLCGEVVLFGRSKLYRNYREELFQDLKLCLLRRELLYCVLIERVLYQRFYCSWVYCVSCVCSVSWCSSCLHVLQELTCKTPEASTEGLPFPVQEWDSSQVQTWLRQLNDFLYTNYNKLFKEHQITGLS